MGISREINAGIPIGLAKARYVVRKVAQGYAPSQRHTIGGQTVRKRRVEIDNSFRMGDKVGRHAGGRLCDAGKR